MQEPFSVLLIVITTPLNRIGVRVCIVRLMSTKIDLGGLKVDSDLAKLVEDEIIPGTGVDVNKFWAGLGGIVKDLAPR